MGFGPSQQTGVELSKCHHLCACPSPHCVVYMLPPALQLGKRKVTVVLCRWCFGSSQCWCLDKGSYHFLGCQVGNVAVKYSHHVLLAARYPAFPVPVSNGILILAVKLKSSSKQIKIKLDLFLMQQKLRHSSQSLYKHRLI